MIGLEVKKDSLGGLAGGGVGGGGICFERFGLVIF